MTCVQGLLRLLWGGPEVGVLRDWVRQRMLDVHANMSNLFQIKSQRAIKLGMPYDCF